MAQWKLNFVPALLLAFGTLTLATACQAAPADDQTTASGEPMNVVFFLVDDYGWKDVL